MKINWDALLQVVVVSLIAGIGVVVIGAFAARLLDSGHERQQGGQSGTALLVSAYALFVLAGLIVLFGLWLMIPYF